MKTISSLVCAGLAVALTGGIATAGDMQVVHKVDGRSGYTIQRVMAEEPTTVAVYPSGQNVQIVRVMADQKTGSHVGGQGRAGYSYALRTTD